MKNNFIIAIAITFVSVSCLDDKDCHNEIIIDNNSDKAIYFYRNRNYPDTSIADYNPSLSSAGYKVESKARRGHYDDCFEAEFKRDSIWMYFIFDAYTLESTHWDTVKKYYMVLKRYDITRNDMENSNWTIVYP